MAKKELDLTNLTELLEKADKLKSQERVPVVRGEAALALASSGGEFILTRVLTRTPTLELFGQVLSPGDSIELTPERVARVAGYIKNGSLIPAPYLRAHRASMAHQEFVRVELMPVLESIKHQQKELSIAEGLELSARAQLTEAKRLQESAKSELVSLAESLERLMSA